MSKTLLCGIYYIKNMINDKYYIGQSVDIKRRWIEERCQLNRDEDAWNTHLQASWKLYGKENFEFYVIEICPTEQLDEREQFWINFYDAYYNGYNQSLGGGGTRGWNHTEETRKKLSEVHKQKITEERRQQMSEISKELWDNLEHRKNMSDFKKAWWANPENREKMSGKNSSSYGKPGKKGKDNPMYGVCRSGINSTRHSACIQIETGNYYYTTTDASQQTGINRGHIGEVCRGTRMIAGGYHWRYATEEETANYLMKMGVAI